MTNELRSALKSLKNLPVTDLQKATKTLELIKTTLEALEHSAEIVTDCATLASKNAEQSPAAFRNACKFNDRLNYFASDLLSLLERHEVL